MCRVVSDCRTCCLYVDAGCFIHTSCTSISGSYLGMQAGKIGGNKGLEIGSVMFGKYDSAGTIGVGTHGIG